MVFLLDVDRTVLDDDRITADLRRHLRTEVGRAGEHRYWQRLERLRRTLGYADYLGALQQYRQTYPHDPHVLTLSSFLIDYPFSRRLLPHTFQVIKHCRRMGEVVILSDGDVVFQPHKIERSGLAKAVGDRVLIYVHKEQELRHIRRCYPADHYVLIDDNVRILDAVKATWGRRVTTIFPGRLEGGAARERVRAPREPDISLRRLRDLLKLDAETIQTCALACHQQTARRATNRNATRNVKEAGC
jgi:FMN phosphatase YigB (HAD superfamily)